MQKVYLFLESLFFISFGGIIYYIIEILFRGYSHYSMFLCGGLIFYSISLFNQICTDSLHLITRMIISTLIILVFELIFGFIFNLTLHRQIWDYSDQYFNYKGQICLTFSILWFFLTLPVLYLEKGIRIFFHYNM